MMTMHAERRPIRRVLDAIPTDLLLVVAYAVVVDTLVLASVGWPPVRFLLGMLFLFLVPGYALVAALFPGRPRRTVEGRRVRPGLRDPHDGLVRSERLAVSFGTSVALIPVVAVLLGALAVPLTPETILGSLTVLVLACSLIGAIRRARLRPADRYFPFRRRQTRSDGGRTDERASRRSTVLTVALVLAVGLAGGAFVYGIAAEPPSTEYTSATLVTETDDGDFVASGYPTNGTVGEPITLTLRVDNRRATASDVSAAVVLERLDDSGETIVERDRLTTLENRVQANGRWNATHEVSPTFGGDDLRLAYYVYDGDVPSSVGPDTADHELYHRIDVDTGSSV